MSERTAERIDKVNLDNLRRPTDLELDVVGKTYDDYFKFKSQRDGCVDQFQGNMLEDFLTISRELFWNSVVTPSNDLAALDLSLTIGFVRKEIWDYVGRIVGQDFKGRYNGEGLSTYDIKVLQSVYDHWRFRSNDKVEKFWQVLYGAVNGTVCEYVGYNNAKLKRRYLTEYDKASGGYKIEEKDEYYWNDAWTEIAALEDVYLAKTWERDIQRQGKMIWRHQMSWKDFKRDFHMYDNAEYVYPGNMMQEDSLYFRLLKGAGVTTYDQVEVLKEYDVVEDNFTLIANAVWLNPISGGDKQKRAPMPFNHKMMPFGWTQWKAIDEKFAYGMSTAFELKDHHKMLNVSLTMLAEQELRAIDPPTLSSDFEAPEFIYGQHKVIPVNDVNAYKVMETAEGSPSFFQFVNGLQGLMTSEAQGGASSITPTKQPKSSREVLQLQQMRQEALGNSLLMYYNMLRQEMMLVIKTCLQFYPANKYDDSRILRAIKIPNTPLSNGGIGNLTVRFVKHKQDDIISFFESVDKSVRDGRQNEIIEAPVDVIKKLDFIINGIDIEPTKSGELEKATFFEQVVKPMLEVYVPAGVADISKVYLRHLEKLGEHPADYTSDKIMPQLMSQWGNEMDFKMPKQGVKTTGPGGNGQTDNLNQSKVGIKNGIQGGAPVPLPAQQ